VHLFAPSEERLEMHPFGDEATTGVWQPVGGSVSPDSLGAGTATFCGRWTTTLHYEIVYLVLEGTLEIHHDGAAVHAGPGDLLHMEHDATVTYRSDAGCRLFWACYPGNWEDVIEA
jgi:ethanolamine utilization protein EutQ (cupin superfamily)